MVFVENDSFRNLRRLPTDAFRSIPRLPREALPVAASDLVAWYPFRAGTGEDITAGDSSFGDSTDYSASVNGATFLPSGGVTDIETGANSGAFDFDGTDDKLSAPPDIIPNGDTDITLTAFINPEVITSDGLATVFATGGSGQDADVFAVTLDTFKSQHNLRYQNAGDNVVSSLTVPTKQFSFISVVYRRGGNVEFQLGTQIDTGTIQANNIIASKDSTIGGLFSVDFFFPGIIDNLRLYTTALSKGQRDTIRQKTKP